MLVTAWVIDSQGKSIQPVMTGIQTIHMILSMVCLGTRPAETAPFMRVRTAITSTPSQYAQTADKAR